MNKFFKKIGVSAVLATLFATSAFSYDTYISAQYETITPQNQKVMGIQDTRELIGDKLNVVTISYGLISGKDSKDFLFSGSQFGLYGSFSNSENRDIAAGIDFVLRNKNYVWFAGFRPYFGGNLGIGSRSDKGERKLTSVSVNKYTYVSTEELSSLSHPDVAVFQENTTWLEYGFSIGLEKDITENLSVDIGYIYQMRSYNISYRLEGSPDILNDLNINQRYNGVKLNLNYSF